MKRPFVFFLLVASFLATAVAGPSPASIAQTATYVGGSGQPIAVCSDTPQQTGLLGACFRLPGRSGRVSIAITDAAGPGVGGRYVVSKANGDSLSDGQFCGSVSFDVSSAASNLLVAVNGPQVSVCVVGRSGTVGTITVGGP